ncbi:hypothetical protein RV07_GL003483 [Enterococcus malodoratus]|nr:hypothetical protein RV07_GL003483 [Enterococcus malodoratus]
MGLFAIEKWGDILNGMPLFVVDKKIAGKRYLFNNVCI